jgi:ribonuclease R
MAARNGGKGRKPAAQKRSAVRNKRAGSAGNKYVSGRRSTGPVQRGVHKTAGGARSRTGSGRIRTPYVPVRTGRNSWDDEQNAQLEAMIFDRREFPDAVKAEAAKMPEKLTDVTVQRELGRGRRDLRDKVIVTIDGADTRDVDDGVSLERDADGNWVLGVHIADVAHYVKPGSSLDDEAYRRGTSVYFPDMVLPMLPKELSNGICSLNVGEERLALSVVMKLDPEGQQLDYEIFESLINVRYKITYEDYAALYRETDERREALRAEYAPYLGMLEDMKQLAAVLRARRHARGALDFELPETKVEMGPNGEPADIHPYELTFANNVIEEFMLAANETVATRFAALGVPFIYRNHPAPEAEKLDALENAVRRFGFTLRNRGGTLIQGAIPEMLERCKGHRAEAVIHRLTLTSMGKAVYSDICRGHFGLASEHYTHFTSPIRRYPDLYIHRIIKETLWGAKPETLAARYTDAEAAAADCSDAEREAEKAEFFYTDKLVARYMAGYLGETFVGTVTGVTSFGLFIMLDNSAEGLLFYADMPDNMIFDPRRLSAKGRFTGRTYGLGDRLEVRIAAADEKTGRIQFVFA